MQVGLFATSLILQSDTSGMAFSVTIRRWHAVAAWTWNAGDDVCGICHINYDGCPADCKYPGDDSPVVWGACGHAFHIQCIQKWLSSTNEQRCPMCRRAWEYKSAEDEPQPAQQPQPQSRGARQALDFAQDADQAGDEQQAQQENQEDDPGDGDFSMHSGVSAASLPESLHGRRALDYDLADDMQMGEG